MGWLILSLVLALLLFAGTILWWRVGDQWADDEYKRFGHGGGRAREEHHITPPPAGLPSPHLAAPRPAPRSAPTSARVIPAALYASPSENPPMTTTTTHPAANTDSRPLTQRLKDDNWDMHQIAEHGEGTGSVLRGQWSRADYASMIAQGLLVHQALDAACRTARAARPDLAPHLPALLADEHLLAPAYTKDASYFGLAPASIRPTPGTQRFLAHIAAVQHDPLAVLGLHYVRTGASNGNRFVAQAARKAFDLPHTGEGTAHLDPYADAQRPAWAAFKAALDALPLSSAQQARVVASARKMYEHVISWHAAEHATAQELVARHASRLNKADFDRAHAPAAHHAHRHA
jgi:heme oxygenase